jgi:hypothetical protein
MVRQTPTETCTSLGTKSHIHEACWDQQHLLRIQDTHAAFAHFHKMFEIGAFARAQLSRKLLQGEQLAVEFNTDDQHLPCRQPLSLGTTEGCQAHIVALHNLLGRPQ